MGYIWADGSVTHDRWHCLGLGCKLEDKQILEDIKKEMKSNHALSEGKSWYYDDNRNKVWFDTARITIHGKRLVTDLVEIHGILPNKSELNLPLPTNVPEQFFCHFVRGYFDGDGWAYILENRRLEIAFTGSEQFIRSLQRKIAEPLQLPLYSVYPNGSRWAFRWSALDDVCKLYHWMYPPGTDLYLRRKRETINGFVR